VYYKWKKKNQTQYSNEHSKNVFIIIVVTITIANQTFIWYNLYNLYQYCTHKCFKYFIYFIYFFHFQIFKLGCFGGHPMTPLHSYTPTQKKFRVFSSWLLTAFPAMFCDLQCEEACVGRGPDTDWTEHVQHILQQQV